MKPQIPPHRNWRSYWAGSGRNWCRIWGYLLALFDKEEVVATLLGFLSSSILSEEGLGDLCDVVERSG